MRVAIIGGGITGLVAGAEVAKKENQVFVFEKTDSLGGLAKTFKKKKWQWPLEIFFHHFFSSDKEIKKLLGDLGLEGELAYREARTSVYFQGGIYPFDSPSEILKFPGLKLKDKLRMGGAIFLLRQMPYFSFLEKRTVSDLFPKMIGFPAWNFVWKNLMEGKFGYLMNQVSFSWLWARLKVRSQKLGYLNGSIEEILNMLRKRIEKNGELFLKSQVLRIEPSGSRWRVGTKNEKLNVDKIILALPLSEGLKLAEKFINEKDLKNWRNLKTIGALNLVLRMKNKFLPGETYWLNILEKEFPFIVIVEQTNFVDPGIYNNEHLVYVGGYYDPANSIFESSKEKVLKKFAPYLRRLNPSFEKFLIDFDLFSSLAAQPIFPVNYSQLKPKLEIVPGLYWATPNHIYPWDRGLNFSVKLAKKVANLV